MRPIADSFLSIALAGPLILAVGVLLHALVISDRLYMFTVFGGLAVGGLALPALAWAYAGVRLVLTFIDMISRWVSKAGQWLVGTAHDWIASLADNLVAAGVVCLFVVVVIGVYVGVNRFCGSRWVQRIVGWLLLIVVLVVAVLIFVTLLMVALAVGAWLAGVVSRSLSFFIDPLVTCVRIVVAVLLAAAFLIVLTVFLSQVGQSFWQPFACTVDPRRIRRSGSDLGLSVGGASSLLSAGGLLDPVFAERVESAWLRWPALADVPPLQAFNPMASVLPESVQLDWAPLFAGFTGVPEVVLLSAVCPLAPFVLFASRPQEVTLKILPSIIYVRALFGAGVSLAFLALNGVLSGND